MLAYKCKLDKYDPTVVSAGSRKVILGLGNFLFQDEGFGVHAVLALKEELGEIGDVELLDGGVMGLNLLPLIEECQNLLVLDAIDAGQPAGTIIELNKDEIPLYAGAKLSEHQVSFQEVLGLARFRDRLPNHLYLIGVQPECFSIGIGLSQPVADALPQVTLRAKGILRSWGLI